MVAVRAAEPQHTDAEVAAAAALLDEQGPEPPERPVVYVEPKMPAFGLWLRVTTNLAGEPVRHRVLYGGRGAAKSWSVAQELVQRGTRRIERVLCAREFQRSIRDSVKRLLDDAIFRMGLGVLGKDPFYISTDNEIRGRNGTLFIFHGLHRNENGIKSLEGITLCWVEEAHSVSQRSIDVLIPTIRQEGSEIWWTYNPNLPTDPVDALFRGNNLADEKRQHFRPPPGTVLIPVSYDDNPWFPTTLHRDMEYDRIRDPDKYAHVWEGKYLLRSDAKVFKNWGVMRFDVPEDAVLRNGADWGFAIDPTVLVQCFIGSWSGEPYNSEPVADPDGNVLFVAYEAWAVGCPVDEIPALFAGNDVGQPVPRWENPNERPGVPGAHRWKIVADSARPELIAYLKERGFNIEAAVKGKDSVDEGVEFLRSYDICAHPDNCPHVVDELTHYSYAVDKLTGEVLPKLKDKKNHTIDSLRYALEAARRARSGKLDFSSSGARVTVQGGDRALEEQMQQANVIPAPSGQATGGGAGWGSAPGIRSGVL